MSWWFPLLVGCDKAQAVPPAPDIRVIGGPGSGEGLFALPRAASWDAKNGFLYVVDKSGRIQKFDREGRFVLCWRMPAIEMGRPTGLAVDRDGTLVVNDTHYHRVVRYTGDGRELSSFGGGESRDPGKFIYPVGLAIAPDGTIYVSEYGGNDRVQVFTADGKLLRTWGRYGEKDGEFKRPQGLALAGDRLYVADAGNHRIQVFSTDGMHLASWGDVRYPYSVAVAADGTILVAEYGRHRVARFTPDGKPLATAGTAGLRPGELNTPWGAVPAGDRLFVVDAGNHRVLDWPMSMLGR